MVTTTTNMMMMMIVIPIRIFIRIKKKPSLTPSSQTDTTKTATYTICGLDHYITIKWKTKSVLIFQLISYLVSAPPTVELVPDSYSLGHVLGIDDEAVDKLQQVGLVRNVIATPDLV